MRKKGVDLTPDLWLIKLMLGAIDRSYDSKDEGPSGPGAMQQGQYGGPPPGQYGGVNPPGQYGNPSQYGAPPPGQYGGPPSQGYGRGGGGYPPQGGPGGGNIRY
jgi:hypothetical protein